MAGRQEFKVEGWSGLERALADLPASIARGVPRRAMKRAGEVMAKAIEERIPLGPTGNLRESVTITARSRNLTGLAEYGAALKSGGSRREASQALRAARRGGKSEGTRYELIVGTTAPHSHLVEFGTVERFHKSGKSVGAMPAHPYMRPAFDATSGALLAQVKGELKMEIHRTAARYQKRLAKAAAKG